MFCPYGHNDATQLGYCRDEVHGNLYHLKTLQADAADRGDTRRAKFLARSLDRWWGRLSADEQRYYAIDMDERAS